MMMKMPDNELKALLRLLDDPDAEVFDAVAENILQRGPEVIPTLEAYWEISPEEHLQQRIEQLIHRVYFQRLQEDFFVWCNSPRPELLRGALLVARYQFPNLNTSAILNQFDRIRRNIWLELNNYLTPLEQINVFNSMLFSYYKLQGHELSKHEPKLFCINHTLDTRQGNGYSIGILYLALCELLDVPLFAVDIPRQLLFGYFDWMDAAFSTVTGKAGSRLQFYVDPVNGSVYTEQEVDAYLRKLNALDKKNLTPMDNRSVIYKMLEELALCYRYNRDEERAGDIQRLMQILVTSRLA